MRTGQIAFRIVFGDIFYVGLGIVVAEVSTVVLALAGQLVIRAPDGGLFWDLRPDRLAAVVAMSVGFGLVVPLQAVVLRQARQIARARAAGGLAISSVTGIAAVSCCSPFLVPALAGLLGASGTTTLGVNLTAHRWFVPLSAISLAFLALSGALAARTLVRACAR